MNKIKSRIKDWIARHENLGDHAGGSGHLGHNTAEIVDYEETTNDQGQRCIRFSYRIHTLSEFDAVEEEDHLPPPPLKTGGLLLDDT